LSEKLFYPRMSSTNFYSNIEPLKDFRGITNLDNFIDVPADWYVVITDVVNSTEAIKMGKYKDINLVGASAIAAVLNLDKNIEIPFVFGGDGASLLIPPLLLDPVRKSLNSVKEMAKDSFGLELRVGAVPVEYLYNDLHILKIAKFQISPDYAQAVVIGEGLNQADFLVKHRLETFGLTLQPEEDRLEADYTGLECRWRDVPSLHGETVSILVRVNTPDLPRATMIYDEVLIKLHEIYGDEINHHPLALEKMHLSLDTTNLKSEAKIQARKNFISQSIYIVKAQLENILGKVLINFKLKNGDFDGKKYPQKVIETSDYKKFDGMLRLVISGRPVQRQMLDQFLNFMYQRGELTYGIHTSNRALMTCLVFQRDGNQVHFVDAADGGYAFAAKQLKQQLKEKSS
jgi:hypothetical protein